MEPAHLPKKGVLDEARVRGQGGREEPVRAVEPARVDDVVANEAPRRTKRQLPQRRPAAARVQLLSAPARVNDHFFEMVPQVPIRNVPERGAKAAGIGSRLEALVHPIGNEPALAREQTDLPVATPPAAAPLASEEGIHA